MRHPIFLMEALRQALDWRPMPQKDPPLAKSRKHRPRRAAGVEPRHSN
jgi:hypothetical protein